MTGRDVIIIRNTLEEMIHPQTSAKLFMDNTTSSVIVNDTIKQQKSRAMNMRYFWICDPKTFKNFFIAWKSGQENIEDYFTKHHHVKHHKRVRPIYIQTEKTPRTVLLVLLKPDLQRCVDPADSKME